MKNPYMHKREKHLNGFDRGSLPSAYGRLIATVQAQEDRAMI